MKNKILLLIDTQYDFINGSLAVNGAEDAMNSLATFILENGEEYDKIILTADWHKETHCSFKDNGGIWSRHCVQFSKGATIYQPILDALNTIKADYIVLTKGTNEDREEYSIFKNDKSSKILLNLCDFYNVEHIDITGIALDYCVLDTVKDGKKKLPNVKFHLYSEMSPSIGDKEEVIKNYQIHNVEVL